MVYGFSRALSFFPSAVPRRAQGRMKELPCLDHLELSFTLWVSPDAATKD